jgi:hypothetical protein
MTENPYASPLAPYEPPRSEAAPRPDAPPYALFSPADVFVATWLGMLLGGALAMAANYLRLGLRTAAIRTLAVGVALQAIWWLTLPIVESLDGSPTLAAIPLVLAGVFGPWAVARATQAGQYALHIARGGRRAAAGYVLLCGIVGGLPQVLIAVIVAAVLGRL